MIVLNFRRFMKVNQNCNIRFYNGEQKENALEFYNLMNSGQQLSIKALPYVLNIKMVKENSCIKF